MSIIVILHHKILINFYQTAKCYQTYLYKQQSNPQSNPLNKKVKTLTTNSKL